MNHLNSILVEGNLVRDPNLRGTPSGNQVCDFTVATNRSYKVADQKYENEVSYFDVEAWSRLGAACAQNLKKGRGVRVVGRLKQDRWTDTEGKPHARVKIVAEHTRIQADDKGQQRRNFKIRRNIHRGGKTQRGKHGGVLKETWRVKRGLRLYPRPSPMPGGTGFRCNQARATTKTCP